MKRFKTIALFVATCTVLPFFISCGVTYQQKTSSLENNLFVQDFDKATAEIDNNKFLQKDRNRLLYLMEKGKVAHMQGNYEESNKLFEEAYIIIDDGIRTNAGQAIAGALTNPMKEPYKGEDFEKVTIHYYKALNYFKLGQPNEALVEAKRINIKLQELNQRYTKNKNKYTEDAFAQILQGILYEAVGDINNAFIAYRNAEELYVANNDQYYGVPLPNQLKQDLLRTSKILGFTQEYNEYKKKFGLTYDTKNTPKGEAIVFWENGLGPVKDQMKLTAAGGGGMFVGVYDDGEENLVIPVPAGVNIGISSIAIPKYKQRESYYSGAEIISGENSEKFELAEDFFPIAKQCLRDRMLREVAKTIVRLGAKKGVSAAGGAIANHFLGSLGGKLVKTGLDVAGAVTENADTRNWQTLPATISYARVPLQEEENTFIIKKNGPGATVDYDTLHIGFKRGLQLVSYFDVGRTTSNYIMGKPSQNNTDTNTAASLKQDQLDPSLALNNPTEFQQQYKQTKEYKEIEANSIQKGIQSLYDAYETTYGRAPSAEEKATISRFFKADYSTRMEYSDSHQQELVNKSKSLSAKEYTKYVQQYTKDTQTYVENNPERKDAYQQLQIMYYCANFKSQLDREPNKQEKAKIVKHFTTDFESIEAKSKSENELSEMFYTLSYKKEHGRAPTQEELNQQNNTNLAAIEAGKFMGNQLALEDLKHNKAAKVIDENEGTDRSQTATLYIIHKDNKHRYERKPNTVYVNNQLVLDRLEPHEYVKVVVTEGLLRVTGTEENTKVPVGIKAEAGKEYYITSQTFYTNKELSVIFSKALTQEEVNNVQKLGVPLTQIASEEMAREMVSTYTEIKPKN